MKRLCILWGLWLGLSIPSMAQNDFKETYKKAKAFITINQDSALVWAKKCIKIARTSNQKYKSYYLLAFNANRSNLYGLALLSYDKARTLAIDSTSFFRVNNNLAKTYLFAGDYSKAKLLNQKSIDFNYKNKQWLNLSYAYELKSMILLRKKDQVALDMLEKAAQLRKKYAPQEMGYTYHNLALAFATFSQYDSAVVYQRKAVIGYPLKSPDKMAQQKILLAKYLVFADQANEALTYLEAARPVQKRPFTKLLWHHTFGLYLSYQQKDQQAKKTFAHCDSLLQNLLEDASNLVTQKTISELALELYKSLLQLKVKKSIIHQKYQRLVDSVQNDIEKYNQELAKRDQLHVKELMQRLRKNSQKPLIPWYYWLSLLIMTTVLGIYWIRRKTYRKAPPELETLVKERQLIEVLEAKAGGPLEKATREMVLLCYQGKSFTQIAQELGVTRDSVKGRFRRLAKKADIVSISKFVQAFDSDLPQK